MEGASALQPLARQAVGGQAVSDDANLVTAPRQFLGQVVDVPEEATDRSPQHLQDTQRLGHDA